MIDRDGFARALLDVLGAPATSSNVAFLIAWQAREGTKAAFNPLATTLPAPGATVFNSIGVRNYPDLATGVDATRRTLIYRDLYAGIVADLRRGDGAAAAHESTELERWSGGGYDHIEIGTIPAPAPPPAPTPQEEHMGVLLRRPNGQVWCVSAAGRWYVEDPVEELPLVEWNIARSDHIEQLSDKQDRGFVLIPVHPNSKIP